jgi:hypothetical protein
MKLKSVVFIMLVMMLAFATSTSASSYAITSLKVNGEAPMGSLAVEPGQTLSIDVNIKGIAGVAKDVKVKAWVGGYEYALIQAETAMFRVRPGVTYAKSLKLQLPDDLSTVSNLYKLHVEVFDAVNVVDKTFDLFVEEQRHDVKVQDLILVPGEKVEAGSVMYAKVRLENVGYKTEKDVKVEVALPELGVSAATYVVKLGSRNTEDNSMSANMLYLKVPDDAKSGLYELDGEVSDNNGYSVVHETRIVKVEGKAEAGQSKSMVSIQSGNEFAKGKQTVVKVLVANLDKRLNVYSVEVGKVGWGNIEAPEMMTLSPGSTGEFMLKVLPEDDGQHSFTLKVKENGAVIMEKVINVKVDSRSDKTLWVLVGLLVMVVAVFVVLSQVQGDKVKKHELEQVR